MTFERIIIDKSEAGHIVAMDPQLVLRARMAIRRRRDLETTVRKAA